jgi:nickel-dependent lactate racemase
MKVQLLYGKGILDVELPDDADVTVIEPRYVNGMENPEAEIDRLLEAPISAPALREWVRPADRVGVVFNDLTRPTPYQLIMPVLLRHLDHVPDDHITLYESLGTHRMNSEEELEAILGKDIVRRYRIVQNDAFDESTQVSPGFTKRGHEIWLNQEFYECDRKILTGFVEPHFFAGFSGGGKAVLPGMGGLRTIMKNHGAEMLDDENSIWGVTAGNPIWEEVHEIASMVGPVFLLNVTLNKDKEITGVFAGGLEQAHAEGCAFVKESAMAEVSSPFDVVITSNAGYPLDLNLYQSVKGMSAASQIVRKGGAIIVAADCWDGIPEHGLFGKLLNEAQSPQELLERIRRPDFHRQDQWQAQIQVKIQLKADVYVCSHNLSDEQIRSALLEPCAKIEETVKKLMEKYGAGARICVLPEGPYTIPYIRHS